MTTMGDRIREKRQEFGWSQSELGRRMVTAGFPKYCQMYVTRSENNVRPIPVGEALVLADVLRVSLQWLATGSPETNTTEDRYHHGYQDGIDAARKALEKL